MTPPNAIPAMDITVSQLDGHTKVSTPVQWRIGIGIQSTIKVINPMIDVRKLGWRPKGGGYSASPELESVGSSTSELLRLSSSSSWFRICS